MQAATVVINRRALRHNLQRLRELAPASKLVAVVKANAYGHGLRDRANADRRRRPLASPAWKRRCACERGHRPADPPAGRLFAAEDLAVIAAQRLHTAVHSPEQLAALEQADLPEPVTVWMKLDTGMHRLGVRPEEAEAFYQRLSQCKNVRQPVNVVSHFARADEPTCGATERCWTSSSPLPKASRACALSPPRAAFCCGRNRITTGCAPELSCMACRRWTIAPPGKISAASR